jgi:hypothetical protein
LVCLFKSIPFDQNLDATPLLSYAPVYYIINYSVFTVHVACDRYGIIGYGVVVFLGSLRAWCMLFVLFVLRGVTRVIFVCILLLTVGATLLFNNRFDLLFFLIFRSISRCLCPLSSPWSFFISSSTLNFSFLVCLPINVLLLTLVC